jgi:hypothetical protein
MAKTPFNDIKSEDILSAHISGIQHSINKMEEVLGMKTASVTAHALVPVADQEDATLHRKIYEGTIRNWLMNPLPVIKRNGVTVSSSEYVLSAAHGVIVFNNQQATNDVITADISHITNKSAFIEAVRQLPFVSPPGLYTSHGVSGGGYATNVSTLSNTMDAFPLLVLEPTTFDKMMFEVSTVAGTKGVMAVYTDNNSFPGTLLAQTTEINTSTIGVKEASFATGDLVLQPGLYWMTRWTDGGASFNKGLNASSAMALGDVLDASILSTVGTGPVGAVRGAAITYTGTYPATFPTLAAGSKYLYRSTYASTWIRRKP